MVQLSDDGFAFGGQLLSLEAAQERLRQGATPIPGEEWAALEQAAGRILARPVFATRSVPPFLNAAVDGHAYAWGTGPRFTLGATVAAGAQTPPPLAPGTAVPILTGAPLPAGADTVVMIEDALVTDAEVTVPEALPRGSNARPKGEDIAEGKQLYPQGHSLSALDVARLAAGGAQGAWVKPPLRIQVFSSGEELRNGQIADVNRWLLEAVFAGPAYRLSFGGVVPDSLAASKAALANLETDLILTSGGVSLGTHDFLRQAIESLGHLEFWRVAIKPGRPVAFGHLACAPIFGLPGNPVACFITAQFLAHPFARALLGSQSPGLPPLIRAPLARAYKKKPGRSEFVRVHLDAAGQARPYEVAGAGIVTSLTATDALAVLGPELRDVAAGTAVPLLMLKGIL